MRLAALVIALVLLSVDALADTFASSSLPFPLASNQVFPARSNRLSLKCYNPTTNAAVTVTYGTSGYSFAMAPGAALWETVRVPSGAISATGTAAQILSCEEIYQ